MTPHSIDQAGGRGLKAWLAAPVPSSPFQARPSSARPLHVFTRQWPLHWESWLRLPLPQGQASSTVFRPFAARLAVLAPGCGSS